MGGAAEAAGAAAVAAAVDAAAGTDDDEMRCGTIGGVEVAVEAAGAEASSAGTSWLDFPAS